VIRIRGTSGDGLLVRTHHRTHPGLVRTLLNVIWFVFSGFWLWLAYMLAGVLCCLLIVTIPGSTNFSGAPD
jgi:hypothetical protein